MKPDAIICHPRDLLYPWWMDRMNKDRDLFDKVIIVMTQSNGDADYSSYILNNIERCTVIEKYDYDGIDWRQSALKRALVASGSEFVLFMEQDFLVEDGFWDEFIKQGKEYNSVGFVDGNRFHPACLLVRRDVLDRTRKDFSVDPDVGDHFKKFSDDLMGIGGHANMRDMKLPRWYHMAGLSQNFRLKENWYQPREFYTYLVGSHRLEQHTRWKQICAAKILQLVDYKPDRKIERFFE